MPPEVPRPHEAHSRPAPPAPSPPAAAPSRPPPAALSWLLLAAAFSPILLDLLGHLARQPWAGYAIVFLPLFALELRRAPAGPRRPRLGWALLVAALAIELLLVGGGLTRAARPALAVAALGMAWIQGRPEARATALLLWFVPIPSEVVSWSSPALEARWAEAAVGLVQLTGSSALLELKRDAAILHVAHGSLRLVENDGGLPVAALLSGLVWFAGLRRRAPLAGTLLRALACASLAAPIQILAIALAAGLVDAGGPARLALDVVPWATVTLVGLLFVWRREHRGPGSDAEPLSSAPG